MGSGAATLRYDQECARGLAGSLWDAQAWENKADNDEGCTLDELEDAAGVVALPFPRDDLIFELTAHGARRLEEDGDPIVDAAGGTRVQTSPLVAQTGTSHAWEGPISLPDGVALGGTYTIGIWMRVAPDVKALGEFIALASCEGGDAAVALRRNGRITAYAGKSEVEDLQLFEDDKVDGNQWMLVFASAAAQKAAAKGVTAGEPPPTMFSVGSDERMVRNLGSVQARCSATAQLEALGAQGIALSEAYVWTRVLSHEEKHAVFARGAARHNVFEEAALVRQLLTGEVVPRSEEEAARFAALLAHIADPANKGVADASAWGFSDADLADVLSVTQRNTRLVELRLSRNIQLTSRGATTHLLAFVEILRPAFILDLSGCTRLGEDDDGALEKTLIEVFGDGPELRGVVIKADETGLSAAAVERLRNATPAAAERAAAAAHAAQASISQTAAFLSMQSQLDAIWAAELDDEADTTSDGDAAASDMLNATEMIVQLQALAAAPGAPALLPPELAALTPPPRQESTEADSDADYGSKKKKGPSGPRRLAGESEEAYQARVAEAARKYEEYLEARKRSRALLKQAAESASVLEDGTARRGSGMLMAHFAYIGGILDPAKILPYSHFGLKHVAVDGTRKLGKYQGAKGALEFHAAVTAGILKIVKATGHSFGDEALHLEVKNTSASALVIVLCAGTVFEHIGWVHRQNLMVIADCQMKLGVKGSASCRINAHCMNSMCGCSNGNPMYLTDFYFDNRDILPYQSSIWEHFNRYLYNQKNKE